MNTKITPESIEHICNQLQRDFRNLRRVVNDMDPEPGTRTFLYRLGHTVDDTCKVLTELSKQQKEKK